MHERKIKDIEWLSMWNFTRYTESMGKIVYVKYIHCKYRLGLTHAKSVSGFCQMIILCISFECAWHMGKKWILPVLLLMAQLE